MFFFPCISVDLVPCCFGDTWNKQPLTPFPQARSFQAISSPVPIFFLPPLAPLPLLSACLHSSSRGCLGSLLFVLMACSVCAVYFLIPQSCFGYSQKSWKSWKWDAQCKPGSGSSLYHVLPKPFPRLFCRILIKPPSGTFQILVGFQFGVFLVKLGLCLPS